MDVRTGLAVAALAATAALPAPAHALAPSQVVSWANGYIVSEVVVVQGGTLRLTNVDPNASHDLRALDTTGGVPLFRSAILGPAQTGDVAGISSLPASVYPFYCSVHDFMNGRVTVVAPPASRP
jgi:plastocyanin